MTINEKIDEIRKIFCGGDNKKFAEMLGFSPQYASNICKEGKSVGESQKMHILSVFPSISKSWLFADEGEMLKQIEESEITIEKTLPIYYMNISERIKRYITYKDIKTRRFEILCGLSNGYVRNINDNIGADKLEAILKSFPELNRDWLLYGEGEMLKPTEKEEKLTETEEVITSSENYKLVPLYNFDAVGGMNSYNDVADTTVYIEKYIPFIDARDEDICIPITGNSMIPAYPPGSLVLLREVVMWREYFGYGHVFVLALKDGRRIIKEVRKSEENSKENVLCVSYNASSAPEDLPKSMIDRVYKVVRILTNEGY